MNLTAHDFREAWKITKAFLDDPNETLLILSVNTEPNISSYTIFKIPFGKTISMLYCPTWGSAGPCPGFTFNYSGFYSSQNETSYDIHDSLTRFFPYGNCIRESELRKIIIKEIQEAAAKYIAENIEEFSGLSVISESGDIIDEAEKAFSLKELNLSFAAKINIDEWRIDPRAMTEYVDNPEDFLKKKVDDLIKNRKEEFARFWFAHCTSQKILDGIYAESAGGHSDG